MSFSADVTKFVVKAKKNPRKARDGVLLKLFGAIIKQTPVGNPSLWKSKPPPGYVGGRLRGNWQTNVGSPNLDANRTPKEQYTTIARMQMIQDPANDMSAPIYFTNNLPYAQRIEFGSHSTQAPAGMMRINITRFENLMKREAAKVNK